MSKRRLVVGVFLVLAAGSFFAWYLWLTRGKPHVPTQYRPVRARVPCATILKDDPALLITVSEDFMDTQGCGNKPQGIKVVIQANDDLTSALQTFKVSAPHNSNLVGRILDAPRTTFTPEYNTTTWQYVVAIDRARDASERNHLELEFLVADHHEIVAVSWQELCLTAPYR